MMIVARSFLLLAFVSLVLAACSSSSSPPCSPAGTYAVTYTRDKADPGDCGTLETDSAPGNADTYSVTGSGSEFVVSITGLTGGCSSPVDAACRMSLACSVSDGSTLQLALTFMGSGVSGSATLGLASQHCSATYTLTGSRR